jgi:site-specific DNA recombinase
MKKKSSLTPNTSPRVALYARYSTEEQGDQTYTSIDSQFARLREHAKEQGYTITHEFPDAAKSGTNLKRAGYKSLLAHAEEGEFSKVLITYMNRLGRGDAFPLARQALKDEGVELETVCETFASDIGGYAGEMMTRVMDGMYPVMVKEWTATKMRQMMKEGYACSAAPFGYILVPVEGISVGAGKRHPKKCVPCPVNSLFVIEAFSAAARNPHRPISAASESLKANTDRNWGGPRTKYLLTNRTYLGEARWQEFKNTSAHEAIIPKETFERVAQILGSKRSPQRKTLEAVEGNENTGTQEYLLRGLIYCSCGGRMSPYWAKGRNGKIYRYYQCRYAAKNAAPCPRRDISLDAAHDAVVGEMLRMASTPWRIRKTLEAAADYLPNLDTLHKEIATARKLVARQTASIERLVIAISVAKGAAVTLGAEIERVSAERAGTQAHIKMLEGEVSRYRESRPTAAHLQSVVSRMSDLWQHATQEEQATLIGLFVERVDIVDKYYLNVCIISDFNGGINPEQNGAILPQNDLLPLTLPRGENQIPQIGASFEGSSPNVSMLNKLRGRRLPESLNRFASRYSK